MARVKKRIIHKEPVAEDYIRAVKRRQDQLIESDWYKAVQAAVTKLDPPPNKIRCLALAGPSEWQSAQFQLAFLLLIQEFLNVDANAVTVWDPAFGDMDRQIIELCNYRVCEQDADAVDDKTTLWYIPHAPLSVMLAHTHLIKRCFGNDMNLFDLNVSKEETERQALLDVWSKAETIKFPLSSKDPWFQAMHDLALQVFIE